MVDQTRSQAYHFYPCSSSRLQRGWPPQPARSSVISSCRVTGWVAGSLVGRSLDHELSDGCDGTSALRSFTLTVAHTITVSRLLYLYLLPTANCGSTRYVGQQCATCSSIAHPSSLFLVQNTTMAAASTDESSDSLIRYPHTHALRILPSFPPHSHPPSSQHDSDASVTFVSPPSSSSPFAVSSRPALSPSRRRSSSALVRRASLTREQLRFMCAYLEGHPLVRYFHLSHISVAPYSLQSEWTDRYVRHTRAAIEQLGRGDFTLLTSFLTSDTELRVFSALRSCPGYERLSEPFYGPQGQMAAYVIILNSLTWLSFHADIMPVVSDNEWEIKILLTGQSRVKVTRSGRAVSWNYARFWIWDAHAGVLLRQQYHEMDQELADAVMDDMMHPLLIESGAAPYLPAASHQPLIEPESEVAQYTIPPLHPYELSSHLAQLSPPQISPAPSWASSYHWDGLRGPSDVWEDDRTSIAQHSETVIISRHDHHLGSTRPTAVSSSSHHTPAYTPSASSPSSSVIPSGHEAAAHSTTARPVADGKDTSVKCKLYPLLPGCQRTLPVDSSPQRSNRGVRSMCGPCRSVCVFSSGSGRQTVYKPFSIDHARVLFVSLQVVHRGSSSSDDNGYSGKTEATAFSPTASSSGTSHRRKRRLNEPVNSTHTVPEQARTSELKLDNQGLLMKRNRTLTISSSSTESLSVTAKRLTVHVSPTEELYVYVFPSADDATLACQHWLQLATMLQHVRLSCHRLLSELGLKYHHTGEEIQIDPEQLNKLMAVDSELLVVQALQSHITSA